MRSYSRAELMQKLDEIVKMIGKMPTQRELRDYGISEDPYYREFGNWSGAKEAFKNYDGGAGLHPPVDNAAVRSTSSLTTANGAVEKLLEQLKHNVTVDELKAIVQSTRGVNPNVENVPIHNKVQGMFKALVTGDWHVGHQKFREDWFNDMVERATKEKVDFCWATGDLAEGMSNRPGHIYELEDIGFEQQFSRLKRLIKSMPFQVRGITGNHCLWGMQKADQGVDLGKRLEDALDNFVYLGQHEAVDTIGGVKVMLWHGNDGSAYSISYRTQKFIENLYGGTKPNILLAGHSHKSLFYETRNVHAIETGTLCMQTGFMRNKKLAACTGYWILTVEYNEFGIVRLTPEWNAYY